jgi:hypothetical protein
MVVFRSRAAFDREPVERLIDSQLVASKQTVDGIFQLGLLDRGELVKDFFEPSLAEMGELFEDVRVAVEEYQEASSVYPFHDRGGWIAHYAEKEIRGGERRIIVGMRGGVIPGHGFDALV